MTTTTPIAPQPHTFQDLRHALENYTFPEGFAGKLVQETHLPLQEIAALLHEYRRFLIMAAVGGQSITPSQRVDDAWHLHLTYSRDYWERLVPLLGRPLHHEPAGSAHEHAHYQEQYIRTLMLYRDTFGEDAPQRWWPDPRRRTAPLPPAGNKMTFGEFLRGLPALFRRGSRLRRGLNTLSFLALIIWFVWVSQGGWEHLSATKVLLGLGIGGTWLATRDSSRGGNGDSDFDFDVGSDGDGGDGGSGCGGGCGGGCGS